MTTSPMEPGSSGAPGQTLYINNLNDKLNRHELRRLLYHLFSSYGYVYDVVASRHGKMRGQAFVAFDSAGNAASAMQALQGFEVCGKPIHIAFAKGKSDAVAKMDGTFQMKDIRKRDLKRREERKTQIETYYATMKQHTKGTKPEEKKVGLGY